MEKKNNNGVLVGVLIGIIVMLLVFGILYITKTISFTTNKENNKENNIINNSKQITGNYEFYEFAEPNQNMTYTLQISKDNTVILNIDGFQTMKRIKARAEQKENKYNIIYQENLNNNQNESYKEGEILFTLYYENEKLYTKWEKLQPMLEKNKEAGIYFKLKENANASNEESNKEDNQINEVINYEQIAKEKVPTMAIIAHRWNYCGKYDKNDRILKNDSNNIPREYWKATDFKTIKELSDFLHKTISEELINKYYDFNDTSRFFEKDGNLYFQPSSKDCGYDFVYDDTRLKNETTYEIINQTETSFDIIAKVPYTVGCGEESNNTLTLTINVTISKINNSWIIIKYEDDSIYKVKY